MTTAKKTNTARKPAPAKGGMNVDAQQTSLAKINANIALLRKNSNLFRDKVQETLVLVARHADTYGDCSAMARLMNDGLCNWHRRGPICDYVRDFTPIIVTFKQGVAVAKFEEKDQRKPFNIDGMVATPWFEHKSLAKDNELPLTVDEVDTNVIKLADRLAKQIKDGKIAASAIEHTQAIIDGIKATVAKVRVPNPAPKPADTPAVDPAAAVMNAASAVA